MRRRQFKRSGRRPMRFTDDDLIVLQRVAKYGLLEGTSMCAAVPHRSPKKMLHRFRLMYDNGYLDRPLAQRENHTQLGKTPIIYALGNRGAQILSEKTDFVAPKTNWTKKNRSIQQPHIQHRLRIADVAQAVDRLPHYHPDVSVISAQSILQSAPLRTQQDQKPWAWRARALTREGSLHSTTNVPDFVFGIDRADERKRYYYFLEADRRTMPVVRSTRKQTAIIRKFEGYLSGYHTGVHTSRFGIQNIRFLFVTTSQLRIDTMIAALREVAGEKDASMFLFADRNALTETPDLLAVPWRDGRDQIVSLLSQPITLAPNH